MGSGNSSPRAKKSVSLSVILGTLLVPLSAYAASTLFDAGDAAESVRHRRHTGGSGRNRPAHRGRPGYSL